MYWWLPTLQLQHLSFPLSFSPVYQTYCWHFHLNVPHRHQTNTSKTEWLSTYINDLFLYIFSISVGVTTIHLVIPVSLESHPPWLCPHPDLHHSTKSYLFNISWFCLVSSWLSLLKSRPPASLAWITAIASSCFHSCFFLSILLIVIIIIYLCLSVCPLDYKLLDGRNQILLMFISRMLSHIGDFHYFSFKQKPSSLIAASVSHQQLPLAQLFLDDLPLLQILHF